MENCFNPTHREYDTSSEIPCKIVGSDVFEDAIRSACEASLERLQTNYIDMYQLHDGELEIEKAKEDQNGNSRRNAIASSLEEV